MCHNEVTPLGRHKRTYDTACSMANIFSTCQTFGVKSNKKWLIMSHRDFHGWNSEIPVLISILNFKINLSCVDKNFNYFSKFWQSPEPVQRWAVHFKIDLEFRRLKHMYLFLHRWRGLRKKPFDQFCPRTWDIELTKSEFMNSFSEFDMSSD